MEYNNNLSGAKQYVSDFISTKLDAFDGSLTIFMIRYSEIMGSISAFHAIGLLDHLERADLDTSVELAHGRYIKRLGSTPQQI